MWIAEMMGELKSEGRLPEDTKPPKLLKKPRFITNDNKLVVIEKRESFVVLLAKIGGKYRAMMVIIVSCLLSTSPRTHAEHGS